MQLTHNSKYSVLVVIPCAFYDYPILVVNTIILNILMWVLFSFNSGADNSNNDDSKQQQKEHVHVCVGIAVCLM